MTVVSYKDKLTGSKPWKPLLISLKSHAGRNSQGRITVRHQGGGNKKRYRIIDFKQNLLDVKGVVETIEYDPYRTAFIALVKYENNERRYVLACEGMKEGLQIITSENAPLKSGNRLKLKNIPIGYQVYNVELKPGRGGQLARSAGSYLEILAHDKGYTDLKMSSGEVRRVLWDGFASLGQASNQEHSLVNIGKAGRSRWLGIRPTVRGSVMNPVDHPLGGGEGKSSGGRHPVSPWGQKAKGLKTRNSKRTDSFIIRRRK
jgi:large subunit ribosomal protein L2